MSEEQKNENEQKSVFSTVKRILLVFFIGFSIYLFVSTIMLVSLTKSEKEIKVPDVTGRRFMDIHNSLVRQGFSIDLKFRDVFDIDDGIVLSQYPEAGRILSEGSTIKLTVSRSEIIFDVPNLIGMELPIAVSKLRNLHHHGRQISVSVGMVSYIPSEKSADNIVMSQSPMSGEKMTPDVKINLLVSAGSLKLDNKMPDLTGQSLNLCYDLLLAKGVYVKEVFRKTSKIEKSGEIFNQSPNKGRRLKKGDSVTLTVLHYPMKEHPYVAYEKVKFRIPGDEKAGVYEAIIEDNLSKRIRFSREMKPGQNIEFLFKRVGNSKITITRDKKNVRVMSIDVEEDFR